jgi:hypothetical protein
MSRCPVCGKDICGSCICGFCFACIKKYGHEKCIEMVIENNKEKKNCRNNK